MGCFGGTKIEAPQPTAEERALQAQQRMALEQQMAIMQNQQFAAEEQRGLYKNALAAEQARQASERQRWDEYWQSPEGQMRKKYDFRQLGIANLEADRYEKALKGTLPISEGTIQREAEERKQLESSLSARLGSNWESSTSGIQSLDAFDKRWSALKDAERHGELQQGAQSSLSRSGLAEQSENSDWAKYMQGRGFESSLFGNTFNQSGIANQFGFGEGLAGYSNLIGGYAAAQQPYQQQRSLENSVNISNAQNSGGFSGLFGNVLGMGAGMLLGPSKPWIF